MNKKLLVNEWFKTYSVMDVSPECFENSPEIESCGSMTGFKIHSIENLNFRISELQNKGFTED